ncbi:pyroglutamyl-peptidase I [Dokdonella immobilis]|uniref:Pyrrolidone-carboxylate peptidase n=1 Tax=Dokdonella immobilis TaxID=578942 RepID=A0A1I4XIP5_9GAMM|nr:pyroglutamyl-peptidase I [Dokdonella immobilis]SFN25751.1 pyroglutamyl-peptidase [Dokdonella immobilis]
MSEPVVLIAGFEPFAGEPVNPSAEIARCLDGESIAGHRVVGAVLPVSFTEAPTALAEWLDRCRPALVIALGQAGGRSEISLERVAVNLIDARIPDNAGLQPIDKPVLEDGPMAYLSSLPVKAIRAALHELDVPASLSLSAGSFVCNQVFYWLAHLLATEHPGLRGGFIHVPWLPEQLVAHPGEPCLPLSTMLHGIRAAIACAVTTATDLEVAGGTTH